MRVIDFLTQNGKMAFSFEILPPLKGSHIGKAFETIELLREFNPAYINITTHRSEEAYKDTENGLYKRVSQRMRPGTVAIAAAIQHKYQITAVPHLICSGFTKAETEYALIDLNFLDIHDLLILRGDKAKHDARFVPTVDGHRHAIDLQEQVNNFNSGLFTDGTAMEVIPTPFSYGVAGYPEKHDEAPNFESDLQWAKEKVERGASYIVTQMFFDNQKFFNFVKACRAIGISVPIVPGIKPITGCAQLTLLPKVFHIDLPRPLAEALAQCKNDLEAKALGVEWCIAQTKELKAAGVPSIHFYAMQAVQSVRSVAKEIY